MLRDELFVDLTFAQGGTEGEQNIIRLRNTLELDILWRSNATTLQSTPASCRRFQCNTSKKRIHGASKFTPT